MIARTTYHRFAIGMSSRSPFILVFHAASPPWRLRTKTRRLRNHFQPAETETQSEMRPSSAYEHYAQTEAHGCCYPHAGTYSDPNHSTEIERADCPDFIQIPQIPQAMQTKPKTKQIHCSPTIVADGAPCSSFPSQCNRNEHDPA